MLEDLSEQYGSTQADLGEQSVDECSLVGHQTQVGVNRHSEYAWRVQVRWPASIAGFGKHLADGGRNFAWQWPELKEVLIQCLGHRQIADFNLQLPHGGNQVAVHIVAEFSMGRALVERSYVCHVEQAIAVQPLVRVGLEQEGTAEPAEVGVEGLADLDGEGEAGHGGLRAWVCGRLEPTLLPGSSQK